MRSKIELANEIRGLCETRCKELDPHFNPATLSKLCAIASYCLTDVFNDSGYTAELMLGEYINTAGINSLHCWVQSEDEIWDLTATQFDWGANPSVLRTSVSDPRFINGVAVPLSKAEHYFWTWPNNQAPYWRNISLILDDFYAASQQRTYV